MSNRNGACTETGKRMFWSRADAKQFIRQHHYKNHQAYRCEACNWYHVGGQHGVKSRIAHREGMHLTPIPDAARMLGVSQSIVRLIIASGKADGNDDGIRTQDLEELQKAMWRV